MKEKGKQITLLVISVCLITVGYLNYNYNEKNYMEVSAETNSVNIGDVQLVNSDTASENETETAVVPNDNKEEKDNYDYFTKTRLERDIMYSEMITTYQKMIDSMEVSVEQKAIATQEISNITNIKNGTMIAENLIKNRGFEDVAILVNNNIVSVVVKTSILNTEQIAKIQNIVARELNAKIENINISNKN